MNRNDTGGRCSGTMIENSHVLTAAHCLSDSNSNPVPTNQIQVCVGTSPATCSSYSTGVHSVYFPSGYTGGGAGGSTDWDDDWAVIKLSFQYFPTSSHLTLSAASDSTLLDLTRIRTHGFPGFNQTCQANFALLRNVEVEPVASVTSKTVRFRVDNVAGQSGSPFYYCPANADPSFCTSSTPGYVYAVDAGFNSVTMREVGAKVPYFRSTAIAFMQGAPQ